MINSIKGYSQITYPTKNEKIETKKSESTVDNKKEDVAATFKKSETEEVKTTEKSNQDIIAKLKADVEMRTAQLESLVQKMFNKQGITFNNSSDIYSILSSGNFTVDPETAAQAKEDISEDGYWGVKQTSDRMVDFAMALAGNDPEKADTMIEAVKKGYEQATATWGGELPDICKQTLDTTISKLEQWRDGLNSTEEKTEEV